MKNNTNVGGNAQKKAAPVAADFKKVTPTHDSSQTKGSLGHQRENSQGTAAGQHVTQHDAITDGQKLLSKEGHTFEKENVNDHSKIELLQVDSENDESKQAPKEYKSKELRMIRPLTSEEVKERFKYQIDLAVDEKSKGVMYWINHIGDKCVTVENQSDTKEDENKNTMLINYYIFRLYNSEFIQIGYFKYLNEFIDQDRFYEGSCTFSPDGHYFGMLFNTDYLGLAYFPHGFEYDMFVEQSYGEAAFNQMFKNSKQYVQLKKQIELDVPCTDEEYLKRKDQDESEDEDDEESEEQDQKGKNKKKPAQKPLKGNPEIIKEEHFKLRISKTNHIYLFRDATVKDKSVSDSESKRFNVYKSNVTVDRYIAAIDPLPIEVIPGDQQEHAYKRINMLDYFSKVKSLANKLEYMYVRGPLVIGIGKPGIEKENEREFKIEFFYDYEEDKIVQVDLNGALKKQEMNQLTTHVIFQPSLGQGKVKWYLVAFGIQKMHVFKRQINEQTKEISLLYRYSLAYPEDQLDLLDDDVPIKVIGMQTLIFAGNKSLQYFKIEVDAESEKQLVFKREIPSPKGRGNRIYGEDLMIQMHQSSLFFLNENQICNLSKQPMEYYTSRILIPESIKLDKEFDTSYSFEKKTCAQIIGINCFEEVLSEWDLRIYMGNNYQSVVKANLSDQSKDLKFYSKRLDIAIFSDSKDSGKKKINHKLIIIDLRGKAKPIVIDKPMRIPFIRTFEDGGREILRVFIASEASNTITCHTFTQSIETMIEANFSPSARMHKFTKLYISQKGHEVTIYQQQLTVLQLQNSNHGEFITKTTALEIVNPDLDDLYYWENRIMFIRSKIIRVAEDYSKVEAEIDIKNEFVAYKDVIGFQMGELHFGVFCIENYNGYQNGRLNFQGAVYVYEIATMMLKTQLFNLEIDICFTDFGQERLQSFTTFQKDGGILFFKPQEETIQHQQYILRLQLFNQDLNTVCGVPLQMAIRPNLIAVVNMDSGLLTYYPMNIENKREAFSILSSISLRYHFDDMLDFIDVNPSSISLLDKEKEVISNIQKAQLQDLTSYNVVHRSFYFCTLQRNPLFKRFITQVIRRLEYLQSQESMPFLLCADINEINPLEEALDNQNGILAQNILQLCISSDEDGLLYAQSINIRLQSLIKMGLDLKPYLNSNLPYHIVEEQYNYGTYDTDPTYRIIASNKQTLIEALLNKETIDSQKEGLRKKISSFLINPEKEVQRYRIAYNIVNMKDLIGDIGNQDPTNSIKVINDLCKNDISYYEIEVLQAIIRFKWQTYTKKYFQWQFVFLIIFVAVYITDLIFGSKLFGLSERTQWKGFVGTRVICQSILIYFLKFELVQMSRIKFSEYISSIWNINDILLQLTYTTYLILSFVAPTQLYAIKALQSCIIYVTFVKIGFYMRIFSELSFLVQMLLNVFYDLRFFLFFFGVVIGSFALYLGILVNELTDYEGIGVFGYFAIALRTSLGDYDFDSFVKNSDYDILTWLVWFLIMIVGNVVFMNFIIAVVSQSYESCMQSMQAQSYKVKVDLIMERESLMNQADLQRREWFPNFIVVRKPLLDGVDASHAGESYGEWQGLLREMQKGVKRQNETIKEEMKKNNIRIENQISKVNTEMIEIKEMLTQMKKVQNDVMNKKK